ncbi:MAG: DUF2384 domain-containing protein [Betaproteobacteria bacterium]|nr:DUF2384 domain-containing protein [Betaproteobacteria bacterium]
MNELSRVTRLLGGKAVLGTELRSTAQVIEMIKRGVPVGAFAALTRALDLSANEMAKVAGIAQRTIARRVGESRLKVEESNRLYRIASVTALAEEVFGGIDAARAWLRQPNRALGGATPLVMIETDIGNQEVRDVLGRIVYGVIS